jgi:hypothetical protein
MARRKQQVSEAVFHDLGNHATRRVAQVMRDTIALLDTRMEAYSLSASVVGGIICWLASLHPGKMSHAAKIALVMKDLAEIMEMHREHHAQE